jgi:hypothetical protein
MRRQVENSFSATYCSPKGSTKVKYQGYSRATESERALSVFRGQDLSIRNGVRYKSTLQFTFASVSSTEFLARIWSFQLEASSNGDVFSVA